MNTTPNSDPDSQEASAEDATTNPNSSGSSAGDEQSGDSAPVSTDSEKQAEDDLPEREPLTPELVEDEALRGDFMLRWAMVLLALLIACTTISETSTLIHVKSGQYTLENGMPARTGVFSATAADRPWMNLSWLFDVFLAGVFAVGGAVGLSIFKALLAAVVFALIVHTNRKDVSTWWGTICAALALVVAHRHLTARPEIVTLLGLAVTLWLLNGWREGRQSKHLKLLVVVFFLWSNMDPGMFYGLAALVLYALGETAGNWLGYSGLDDDADRKKLWMAVGGCVAVTLLNPFGWNALLAPLVRYTVEYPGFQGYFSNLQGYTSLQYFPIWQPEFWTSIGPAEVSGLVLAGSALITFVLNFRRLDFGDFVMWVGFVGFAAIATHEFAAAAIVSAVLATLNAQQWYQHTFRQTYSVETSELVFSRGGRAVTVLALFGLAYLSISGVGGWLQRRTGVGFDADLQASIESFDEQLKDGYDDRPFNFVLWQGDVLVWIGKKPFIDSRLSLFSGDGENDLITLHKECRTNLNSGRQGNAGRQWMPTFDRFEISHVVPRMDSRVRNTPVVYGLFFALVQSGDWQLASFGATTAVFYRTDLRKPDYSTFLEKHQFDFIKAAFRMRTEEPETEEPEMRLEWARPRNFTERWLSRPRSHTPNPIEQAKNNLKFLEQLMTFLNRTTRQSPPRTFQTTLFNLAPTATANAHLVIRNTNAGLKADPQNANAYRILGRAYSHLEQLETWMVQFSPAAFEANENGDSAKLRRADQSMFLIRQRRYRQAVAAFRQSLIIAPNDVNTLLFLAEVQTANGKFDLAADSYGRWLVLIAGRDDSSETTEEILKGIQSRKQELDRYVTKERNKALKESSSLKEDDESRVQRFQLVQRVSQPGVGCVKLALEIMDEDPELKSLDPRVAMLSIDLLQQAGRAQDAYEELEQLLSKMEDQVRPASFNELQAHAALARADYTKARGIWLVAATRLDQQRLQAVFGTAPLAMRSPVAFVRGLREPGSWAFEQTNALERAFVSIPSRLADLYLQVALTQLEAGDPGKAAEMFRTTIDIAPNSPVQQLAELYLQALTGQRVLPRPGTGKTPPPAPKKKSSPKNTGNRPPVKALRPNRN